MPVECAGAGNSVDEALFYDSFIVCCRVFDRFLSSCCVTAVEAPDQGTDIRIGSAAKLSSPALWALTLAGEQKGHDKVLPMRRQIRLR